MRPALSVIFFTTFSGAGYGLLALIGLISFIEPLVVNLYFSGLAYIVAFSLIIAGLSSSTLHLHHPKRAWRAFSQWRTSWLSREAISALATFIPAVGLAVCQIFSLAPLSIQLALGLLTVGMALITVFFTSMIYASLRTVQQWNHPLVASLYLLFSLSSGLVVYIFLYVFFGEITLSHVAFGAGILLLNLSVKLYYWRLMDTRPEESSIETATGLGSIGKVRQLDAPHASENWVMREMGFVVARKHIKILRRIYIWLGAIVPTLCLLVALANSPPIELIVVLMCFSMFIGILAERWLFFAEAQHVVGNYYDRHPL